jgi:hypothetical protein
MRRGEIVPDRDPRWLGCSGSRGPGVREMSARAVP